MVSQQHQYGRASKRQNAPREGKVAKAIEKQTSKVPSDAFLWAAGGAVAASLVLRLMGKKSASNFVGEWVPSILICGVYNKIVKVHGHDQIEDTAADDQGEGEGQDEGQDQSELAGGLESRQHANKQHGDPLLHRGGDQAV
jgi:hypothetical protein